MEPKFKSHRTLPVADIDITIDDKDKITMNNKSTFNPKKLHHKIKNKHPLTKKEKWIVVIEILIVLAAIAVVVFIFTRSTKLEKGTAQKTNKVVVVKPIVSRLTGLPVTAAQEALPVTGVMIENSDDARPQSGLSQAGVVYEALAEGGITRFLALFEDNTTSSIGPVRSARPYFIDWLLPYDAGYAHVGGSPTALSEIQSLNVKDLNQFYNSSAYQRISSRAAPHNVYTSTPSLLSLESSKGWTKSDFTGFPRKADSPNKAPNASKITLNIAGSDMNVQYQYNPTKNHYLRSEGGSPMIDAGNNQQISPKVVIAMVVPWTDGALDSSNAYYTVYSDVGSGTADIFQDGVVYPGTWTKTSQNSKIQFTNAAGVPIKLNAGQTWITALGESSEIIYQ